MPQPCEAHTAQLRPTARTLRNLRAAAASGDEAPHFGASMPQQVGGARSDIAVMARRATVVSYAALLAAAMGVFES